MRRAFKTAYYLNRTLPRLALVGRGVRLPNTEGVWVPVSDGAKKRCEVVRILSLAHPGIDSEQVPYAALLTDFDVEQFESHVCPPTSPIAERDSGLGQQQLESGTAGIDGGNADGAAMRKHDLLHDEQSESQASRARDVGSPPERFEDGS